MRRLGALVLLLAVGAGCSSSRARAAHVNRDQPSDLGIVELDQGVGTSGHVLPAKQVQTHPFSVAELPVFLEQPPAPVSGSERLGVGPIPEIVVSRQGDRAILALTPRATAVGRITIGVRQSRGERGLEVACGTAQSAPLLLELLQFDSQGAAVLTQASGSFDAQSCTTNEVGRATARLGTIIPGYVYGYRSCPADGCREGNDRLTFLTPGFSALEVGGLGTIESKAGQPFGQVTMSLSRGMAVSMNAMLDDRLHQRMFSSTRPAFLAQSGRRVVIGIDVVHATEESGPSGVASIGVADQPEFEFHGDVPEISGN